MRVGGAAGGDVWRREDQCDGEAGGAACGAARAARHPDPGGRRQCRARRARGARPYGGVCRPGAQRGVAGIYGQADPQYRQYRHRRVGPGAGDGVRGAAALLPARPHVPLCVECGRHGFCRGDTGPGCGGDAVYRGVEDVYDAGDDDERAHGAGVAARAAARREGGGQPLCGRIDQRRRGRQVRHRYGQHVWLLGLGGRSLFDGLGDRSRRR